MDIRPLPADEEAVRRFAEALWLPYHRELEATVEAHALADDDRLDILAEEVAFRLDRLETEGCRAWIAVEGAPDGTDVARGELVGFVTTEVDETPPVFDRPDRLVVCDIYVSEPYRGSGLARELLERVATEARDRACAELALDVDADNERAIAFYERVGFEPRRHRMRLSVEEL